MVECSELLYDEPVSPPVVQQFCPLAAPVITGLLGDPYVQEELVPPFNQMPGPASKSSK